MSKKIEILSLFLELDCQSSVNQLVEKTFKVALSYLKYNHKKILKILEADDLSFEDVAISAITPLFYKKSEEQILPIIKEFNYWKPPIQTEEDALFFLNKVVANRVDQHISHLLKEQDPFFAKIFDSVNYLIRKGGYKKISCFGRRCIVHQECAEINSKVIDQESFENLPFTLFLNTKTLLPDILKYLEMETDFFPAIPINALVTRIRSLNASDFLVIDTINDSSSNIDADEIVKIGYKSALDKLRVSYYEKGKLTDCELVIFKKALDDMAKDLKDGSVNRGLFVYLETHMPGLSKQEYHDKYRNILEYLLKVMKNTISSKLLEERI